MIYNLSTSKRKTKVIIPESWTDRNMTTGMFEQLAEWDGKDLVKLFSILSGIEVKVLYDTYDPALEVQLLESTNFVYTPFDFKSLKRPKTLNINGKIIEVPTDLKGLTIGQNILVRQEAVKYKYHEQMISFAMAVYLQPLIDGEPDHKKALELQDKIKQMPIVETYPIGFFLLKPRIRFGMIISRLANRTYRTICNLFTRKGKALPAMPN